MASPGGLVVEFRDNETDELLWEASMHMLPGEDAVIRHVDVDGVTTTYEVKGTAFGFFTPDARDSYSSEISVTTSRCKPIVYVKEA